MENPCHEISQNVHEYTQKKGRQSEQLGAAFNEKHKWKLKVTEATQVYNIETTATEMRQDV